MTFDLVMSNFDDTLWLTSDEIYIVDACNKEMC